MDDMNGQVLGADDGVAHDGEASALAGLEAILFIAAEPIRVEDLSLALELGTEQVNQLIEVLDERLQSRQAGVTIRNVGGGWRMYAGELGYEHVERFVLAGRSGRLSQAALETLAVIAYKQPIARSDIGEVRGVNPDGAVRSLAARGLITEVGRDEGPGQAVLYGTTQDFLVKLGLDRLEDLPPLADYLIDEDAPDEPAPDQLRAARRLLQLGQRLPSTGAAQWMPAGDADGASPNDDDENGDDEVAEPDPAVIAQQAAAERLRARSEMVQRRRDQESEMDDLTAKMESAATAAMSTLQDAVEAVTEPDDELDELDDQSPEPTNDEPEAELAAAPIDPTPEGEAPS